MMSNDLSSISTQSSYHLTKDDVDRTGYDLHFKKKVHDDLRCNLCRYPLRLPNQSACGCRYCSACIKRYLEKHKIDDEFDCPSCEETISSAELVPDYRVKKQLDKQIVFCPMNLEGCQAEFPLKELEAHTDICEFTMVKCPNQLNGCIASIRRKDLNKHLEIDCAFRLLQCKYCQELFPKLKVAEHTKRCQFVPTKCPNNCGISIPQAKMDEHLEKDCKNELRQCKFAEYNCTFKGVKCDLEKHIQDSMSKHLDMVLFETVRLRLKDAESQRQIADLENRNSILKEKQKVQAKELEELRVKCDGNTTTLQKFQSSLSSQLDKFNKFEEKLTTVAAIDDVKEIKVMIGPIQEHIRSLRDKMREIENSPGTALGSNGSNGLQLHNIHSRLTQLNKEISLHAASLAEQDVRIQITECASYDGVLLWKINDFERRMHEAKSKKNYSLYSQPFYTSRFGYKMCARVYLNGDGSGSGTHMSLFFVVMKGEYDALLPWPFKQKVTMLLLDQSPSRRHLTDAFKPNPLSSSFQRPVNDMNIASGCPQFVAHGTLNPQTYCKDNTMYIKVIVDIPDPCV